MMLLHPGTLQDYTKRTILFVNANKQRTAAFLHYEVIQMNSNVSLQILPIIPEGDAYTVVDKVIELIRESGVTYVVGPMETTMEGDLNLLMGIVVKAQELCVTIGAKRVISVVKIDYKPAGVTIEEKIGKYRA